jgi:hypothetical protein
MKKEFTVLFWHKKYSYGFLIIISAILVVTMQNCSKTSFAEESFSPVPFCSETQIMNLEMVEQWNWIELLDKTRSMNFPHYDQVMSSPMVADLDGDKVPEVVFTTWNKDHAESITRLVASGTSVVTAEELANFKLWASHSHAGVLRIVSGATGATKFSLGQLEVAPKGDVSPLLIDLNNDGNVEIVYLHFTGRFLISLNSNGSLRWKLNLPSPVNQGVKGLNAFFMNGAAHFAVGPYIISEKAKRPVIMETLPTTLTSLNQQIPISLDGGRTLTLLDSQRGVFKLDGNFKYQNDATVGGNLGVGDIIPELEGLEIAKIYNGKIAVYNNKGELQKSIDLGASPVQCSAGVIGGGVISVANFDGNKNGRMQMAVATGKSMTIVDSEGRIVAQFETRDCSSLSTGITTFDFDGDLKPEILYGDEQYFRIFHLEDGKLIEITKIINPNGTLNEYPVVADIRGDGSSSILVVATNYVTAVDTWYENVEDLNQSKKVTGLRAFGAKKNKWMPARPIWNQYDFIPGAVNNKAQLSSYYNDLGSDIVRRNVLFQSGGEVACQNK